MIIVNIPKCTQSAAGRACPGGGWFRRERASACCRIHYGRRPVLVALLCAALCAAAESPAEDTAYYRGSISAEHNREFFAALAGRPLRRLSITSGGGDVAAAIALGEWVHARTLDVEVPDYCLSSCANYVFPAGRNKLIHPGAVVAWHGNYRHLQETGLWRDDVMTRMQRYGEDEQAATRHVRAQVEELVGLERDFFARIGVDDRLCWIGKLPPYNVPDYYFLSTRDMARFGVVQVQAPADYAATDVSGFAHGIVHIELE